MGNKRHLLAVTVLLSLLLFSITGCAVNEQRFGTLSGADYAFSFEAPDGWVLDTKVARSEGLRAVFYPKGEKWGESPAIIYARSRSKEYRRITLDALVKERVNNRRKQSPQIKAAPAGTISPRYGEPGKIYYYTGDLAVNFERAVYFEAKHAINYFVLSARDEKAFNDSLPAFEQLAKSYSYIGDSPIVEKGEVKGPPDMVDITTDCDRSRLRAIETGLDVGQEQTVVYTYTLKRISHDDWAEISLTGDDFTEDVRNCIIDSSFERLMFTSPLGSAAPINVSFPVNIISSKSKKP